MNIKIIAIGKLKEKFAVEYCSEYVKRLGRFCKLEIAELKDLSIPKDASDAQKCEVIESEGSLILKHIHSGEYVIALCVEGRQLSSEALAKKMLAIMKSASTVTFVIGGSLGLSDAVKGRADYKLSLSEMTLPHNIARLVILEQIYRAFKINSNEEYHK